MEAESPEQAQELYEEAWFNGEITALGYEFSDWNIKEAAEEVGEEEGEQQQSGRARRG